jgi:hypothetical protein
MAYWIRLADVDRARYEGCPEVLPWDSQALSIDEAIEIEERSGLRPAEWATALAKPTAVVWKLVVWLCLNRAGLQIGYSDVRFDWNALGTGQDEEANPGKESSSTPPPGSGIESAA